MKQERLNMIHQSIRKFSGRVRSAAVPYAMFALLATSGATSGFAQQQAQPTFPSAAEATQTLFQAVQKNNVDTITKILGGPTELASSRDDAQDKLDRDLFVQQYQEMHRLRHDSDGLVTMYIGARNWPFPIPLAQKNGAWYFDSDAGLKEVLFRRIGENELDAIATCREFAAAGRQHSTSNTANPTDSLPMSLVAKVAGGSARGDDPVLSNGYYFRVLTRGSSNRTRPGPFALIAYPAEYRSSGVMSFIVTEKSVVYEKDLGGNTSALASAMTTFHKDATWRAAGK